MDLTTTDFIAAFLLAGQLQHCRRHRTIKAILHPKPPLQNHNSSQQPGSSEDAASSRESPMTDGLHGSLRASCSSGYDSIEPGVRMPPVRQRRPTLDGRSTDFEGAFCAVKRAKLCQTPSNTFCLAVRQFCACLCSCKDSCACRSPDRNIQIIGLGSIPCAPDF